MVEESECRECNGWYSIDDSRNVIELLEGPLPWFVVRLQFFLLERFG
jgi:hypothetical protein